MSGDFFDTGIAAMAASSDTAMLSLMPPQVPECSKDSHEHDWERVNEGLATVACNDGDVITDL